MRAPGNKPFPAALPTEPLPEDPAVTWQSIGCCSPRAGHAAAAQRSDLVRVALAGTHIVVSLRRQRQSTPLGKASGVAINRTRCFPPRPRGA